MKEYVVVGHNVLTKELFRNVLRPNENIFFKPNGGLWSCEYTPLYISPWYRYLISNPDLLEYKDIHKASIFTLKDKAKILTIEDTKKLEEETKKYPSYFHMLNYAYEEEKKDSINYELLSKDYDGLYVDYDKLSFDDYNGIFRGWSVNTLLLFNLDVVDKYKSIDIDFLMPDNYFYPKFTKVKEASIKEESIEHKILHNYMNMIFNELLTTKNDFIDYHDYYTFLITCLNKTIKVTMQNHLNFATEIKTSLENMGIHTSEYIIIRNIGLNILSEYLKNNVQIEQTMPKTKIRKAHYYPIDEYQK